MNNFYNTKEWKQLRFRVLIHYQRKCMACNATNKTLHVDHIKPISKFPELKLDFENLQILCEDCNVGKSNIYYHDLRPNKLLIPHSDNPQLLINQKGYLKVTNKICHLWDGIDTACKMWSGGGLKRDKAKVFEKPTSKICLNCEANSNNRHNLT